MSYEDSYDESIPPEYEAIDEIPDEAVKSFNWSWDSHEDTEKRRRAAENARRKYGLNHPSMKKESNAPTELSPLRGPDVKSYSAQNIANFEETESETMTSGNIFKHKFHERFAFILRSLSMTCVQEYFETIARAV